MVGGNVFGMSYLGLLSYGVVLVRVVGRRCVFGVWLGFKGGGCGREGRSSCGGYDER